MKIAVPVVQGKLSMHFGHCETFSIFDVDTETKEITASESFEPPPHEPKVLPKWLAGKGAEIIIAGGMGVRAQGLFQQNNIMVVTGAQSGDPKAIVKDFLAGTLQTGANACDH